MVTPDPIIKIYHYTDEMEPSHHLCMGHDSPDAGRPSTLGNVFDLASWRALGTTPLPQRCSVCSRPKEE